MSAERYRRWERWVRPLALYGLACFPPLVVLGLWHGVAAAMHGEPLSPAAFALANVWGFTVVVSLLATLPPAIASLATDDELSSGRRTGWAVAFFFTGFVASALFVLLRWGRERRLRIPSS
jgi:hydrogenase/urease accessory protein HupE